MIVRLSKSYLNSGSSVTICGSKSESNRLLILKALYPELKIQNLSNSDDTRFLQQALLTNSDIIDIHHAGTAMRFLTSFFATQEGKTITLTGSARMQQRPIKVLVDALTALGADITYLKQNGYPPLRISGKKLTQTKVSIDANVSSQYISSLLLIAPRLENGLELILEGEITSRPYLEMTLSLLRQIGVNTTFYDNTIKIEPLTSATNADSIIVESDWSSASYFYSLIALSSIDTSICLQTFKENSLQGDSILTELYKEFGVSSTFTNEGLMIKKQHPHHNAIEFDLNTSPDLAQTIAVTCLGLGVSCKLTGLHTLKIKETDRLLALKTEIEKFGTLVDITDHTLHLPGSNQLNDNVCVNTYDDHRMAMAFAPLATVKPLAINNAGVVSKSYPDFWNDLKNVGIVFSIENN